MTDFQRATSRNGVPSASAPNVRRNLFSSHASHRTTGSARTAPATTTLADATADANSSEIVVRNSDGAYHFSVTPPTPAEMTPTAEQEAEQKLADMLSNRSRQSSEVELLNAIKASLRRKVASVQDDRWMFEGEGRS